MSNWERLDRNVRKELNLEPDPKKLELALKASVHKANCNPIQIQIFSQTSLFSFRRILEMKPITELNDISEVVLEAKAKTIFKMVKQKETRGGKRAVTEKKMRDLTTILYGDSMARQREGTWTPEANCLHCTGRTRRAGHALMPRRAIQLPLWQTTWQRTSASCETSSGCARPSSRLSATRPT